MKILYVKWYRIIIRCFQLLPVIIKNIVYEIKNKCSKKYNVINEIKLWKNSLCKFNSCGSYMKIL